MDNDEQKARIHAALEKFSGDRPLAAESLGITLATLKNKIYASPDLRTRWSKDETAPPDEIAVLTRDISPDGERLAGSIALEDKKVRNGGMLLGLKPKELETLVALQRFNRENFRCAMDVANAGLTVVGIKLLNQIEAVEARLETVRGKIQDIGDEMTDERVFWVEEEEKLAQNLAALSDAIRKNTGTTLEGAKMLALIAYRQQNGGGAKKLDKPGFRPMDI